MRPRTAAIWGVPRGRASARSYTARCGASVIGLSCARMAGAGTARTRMTASPALRDAKTGITGGTSLALLDPDLPTPSVVRPIASCPLDGGEDRVRPRRLQLRIVAHSLCYA